MCVCIVHPVSLIPIFINFIRSIFYNVILRNNDTIEHRGVTHNNVEEALCGTMSKGSIKCNNINNNNKVV